jgi:hypothetical protein
MASAPNRLTPESAMIRTAITSFVIVASVAVSTACTDTSAPGERVASGLASHSGSGGGGGTTSGGGGIGGGGGGGGAGGGGGGGGGGGVSGVSVLPTTAPAAGILMRESFGLGPNFTIERPAGGNGLLKVDFSEKSINGFWIEYPGSSKTEWLAPDTGQIIEFAGSNNPHELPSPLEAPLGGGAVISPWFHAPTSYPTALMPIAVTLPAAGYELDVDIVPSPFPGAYVAMGFTNSNVLHSNLTTAGALWLRLDVSPDSTWRFHYQLRSGGIATGQLLASGNVDNFDGWPTSSIRYSTAGSVTLSIDGQPLGTFSATLATPKYLAIEGVGTFDNLVLRQ